MSREYFALHGRAVNGRQISISLPNEQNGVTILWGNNEHWNVRGSTIRGGWRHHATQVILKYLRRAKNDYKISTDTARLLDLGGVKSSGASKLMTPLQQERAKRMNPQVEMFGCNDPGFFAGQTFVSHMRSEEPIDRTKNIKYNLQVVRRPLSASGFTSEELSDPERIAEFSEINRFRSQVENMAKRIGSLEGRIARAGSRGDAKLRKDLEQTYVDLNKLTGKEFSNGSEVEDYVKATLDDIRTRGFSTVSEQTIPVGQEVIPIGTNMFQTTHMLGASSLGCGLVIDGMSHKQTVKPFIGGRAAAGCGGWVTIQYQVLRLESVCINKQKNTWQEQWVPDCTLNLVPQQHVEFHNAEHSRLKACYEEWLDCDITQFDFTYEGLQAIAQGNERVED